jgi:hypothetical protein
MAAPFIATDRVKIMLKTAKTNPYKQRNGMFLRPGIKKVGDFIVSAMKSEILTNTSLQNASTIGGSWKRCVRKLMKTAEEDHSVVPTSSIP